MHFEIIFYILLIDLLGIISPGPDFFMVLKNSLTSSRSSGIYTALGIAVGSCLMFSLSIFGVGEMVVANHRILFLIKILGAAYLGYLGLKSLISHSLTKEPEFINKKIECNDSFVAFFKIGLLCNLSNPKSLLFFVSLSAYAIVHNATNLYDSLSVILISTLNTAIWFILVAIAFGNQHFRKLFYRQERIIHIVFGLILLYVAFEIISL